MLNKLFQLLFSHVKHEHAPTGTTRHVIDGKVYTQVVRAGFLYLKDSRGFLTPMKDDRGFYIKADG